INAIDPGYTATDFNQHRGPGSVEDAAAFVASYATIGADGPTGRFFSKDYEEEGNESPWQGLTCSFIQSKHMKITPDYPSMASLAIHGNHGENAEHAHLLPISASSTFTFESAQQGMDRFSGKEPGYVYSRFANPTVRMAEELVAGLEAFGITDKE